MSAVVKDGAMLKAASRRLRDDPDVALAAVLQCGAALQHASEDMRDDERVCPPTEYHPTGYPPYRVLHSRTKTPGPSYHSNDFRVFRSCLRRWKRTAPR